MSLQSMAAYVYVLLLVLPLVVTAEDCPLSCTCTESVMGQEEVMLEVRS